MDIINQVHVQENNFQDDVLQEIIKYKNTFGLHKVFKSIYLNINRPINFNNDMCRKYILMIAFWFFGILIYFFFIVGVYMAEKLKIEQGNVAIILIVCIVLIGLCLNIAFQISFTCLITPFILISIIYHKFFNRVFN